MSQWTASHVLSLAPDAGSAKSGRELASARKWVGFARSETALWGECQGSGKLPYQTQVELSEPAFKCTCPSRKFPCKHGLGLLLMFAADPALFAEAEPPVWVKEWLETRSKKAQAKAEKAAAPKEVDEAAQAKRAAAREKKILAGLDELSLWMGDLVRGGLSQLPGKPYGFFEDMARRMVDAQAPGLARRLRELGEVSLAGEGWAGRVLERLSLIHLAAEGYRRLEAFPLETQADLRAAIGHSEEQAALLAQAGTADHWLVLGQAVEQEDRLRVRRTWLWGEGSDRAALVLDFSANNQPFPGLLMAGSGFEGELVFYPGGHPLRALVKSQAGPRPLDRMPGYADFSEGLAAYAGALGKNPWLGRFPLPLRSVTPVQAGQNWALRDAQNRLLLVEKDFQRGWDLLALSGGRPLGVAGEWDGAAFRPLSAWAGGFHPVGGEA